MINKLPNSKNPNLPILSIVSEPGVVNPNLLKLSYKSLVMVIVIVES